MGYFFHYKEQESNFAEKNSSALTFNKPSVYPVPPDTILAEGHNITSVGFLPQTHSLRSSLEETPPQGTFFKKFLANVIRETQRKTEELPRSQGIKEMGQLNPMHNPEFSFVMKNFNRMVGKI